MKSKLKIIIPLVLVVFGGVYKTVLAKPAVVPKPKVDGEVYVLQKAFLLNLKGGKFVSMGVALVITEGSALPVGGGEEGASPPEGYGTLPQEAVVRDIITDAVSNATAEQMISAEGREKIKKKILKRLKKHTDVKAHEILFTDVAVQ